MVALRLAQPLMLAPQDADPALWDLLAETRHGEVSAISVPSQCLVRMIRTHDPARALECIVAWEPTAADGCSFIGSMSIVQNAAGSALALVLDGIVELHDRAHLQDEHLGTASAEVTGRAVLERIAAELTKRSWPFAAPSRSVTALRTQRFVTSSVPTLRPAKTG